MKFGKLVILTVLFGMIAIGCRTKPTIDDDRIETVFLPFYGETRFMIECVETGTSIPDAELRVSNLSIEEMRGKESIRSGKDGSIIIHQIHRRDKHYGNGPPRPTFTFSAPHYNSQTYSVEDLVSETSYDPYRNDSLPTTIYNYKEEELELPVYEITIRLVPID